MITPADPRTAAELLDAVAAFGPAAEGFDLAFAADPPADLDAAVRALQTGLRALLTGRRWFGISAETGRGGVLDPREPLPAWAGLVCVEGDPRWDRLVPTARLDLPHLFADGPARPRVRATTR